MTMVMPSFADGFEHADQQTVVVFVDLAGFTAFTEAHGDHRAAELAETFATAAEMVLGPGDEMIKTIGDAVMITSADAIAALAFLRRLHEKTRSIHGFPLLRAGISAGSVIKRRGDVFGSTVNTAARLAALAQAGQIVANDEAASALRLAGLDGATSLGPLRLRNLDSPIEAFAIDVGTRHQQHVDPICRMHVATDTAQLTHTHHGITYRFCSTACLDQFARRVGAQTPSTDDADRHERPVLGQ